MKTGFIISTQKIMVTALVIILVVITITAYGNRLSLITNKCWRDVTEGLMPFKGASAGMPEIIIDSECVKKIVFTSSADVCVSTCREIDDEEKRSKCAGSCGTEEEGEAKSYIVAVPSKRGWLGTGTEALREKDYKELIGANPIVHTLLCDIANLDELEGTMKECALQSGSLVCVPPDEKEYRSTYVMELERSEKTCTLKVR
jgi:hypothetical protein